jgi:hypothetical protein
MIFIDLIGPYPRFKQGNIGILIILDHFALSTKKFTAAKVNQYLEDQVFSLFGAPELIMCDNGSQFKSVAFENLLKHYGAHQCGRKSK